MRRRGKLYTMKTARVRNGRATQRRHKDSGPAPELSSLTFLNWTPQQQVHFMNGIGVDAIETVLKAIKPTCQLMSGVAELDRAWKAAKQPERQAFAREHRDEIIALSETSELVTAAGRSADAMRADTSPDDDPLAIPTFLRRGRPTGSS